MPDPLQALKVYTDGSASVHTRCGGWAAVVPLHEEAESAQDFDVLSAGRTQDTTTQRMEIQAAISALYNLSLGGRQPVEIVSDSAYLVNTMNGGWIGNWKANGWRKSDKGAVKNRDLWEQMERVVEVRKVTWTHVRGHSGVAGNEVADHYAGEERKFMEAVQKSEVYA